MKINYKSDFDFFLTLVDSDGELGMYDRVSGDFLTNRGTGTFIAGPATGKHY